MMEPAKRASNPTKKNENGLTDFQKRVADEYLIDGKAGPAYRRAGGKAKDPYRSGCEIVGNPKVDAYIRARQAEIAQKLSVDAETVVKRWMDIATADVNELVQHRRCACRYCYGTDHRFQWIDEEEWLNACAQAENASPPRQLPGNDGGYGFLRSADPHPECLKCDGEGEASVFIADTRRLSPQGLTLYAGLRQSRDGVDIKLQDQLKALENVARYLGMFDSKVNLSVQEENPLAALVRAICDPERREGQTLRPVE
ncbi:terminase small subunit [Halomonas sp. 3H]|uniref:terminase small subunit n=1 Tax=Halomonas sp. 3H TaxID=2952527 RepID=UPI0020B6F3AA|nr:terminase small subunit [Halomonas sp. 3H]